MNRNAHNNNRSLGFELTSYRARRDGAIGALTDSSWETPITPCLLLIESRYPGTGLGARTDEEDSTPETRQNRLALG
jgi:hypothetical protein